MIIPNSIISSEKIENSSIEDEKICKFIEYGISYDSDMKKALKILEEEALKHPLHIDNRTKEEKKKKEPIVKTIVSSLGDSSVNIRAFVWTKNAIDAFNLSCDLNRIIKERFDKEGIDIPFPHRTIVFKKDIDREKLNSMKKKNKKK
jgi:small-conductance mechanosensitive channel